MNAPPCGPLPAELLRHLVTARLGRRIYFYPETGSTNDVAIELARRGEAEGTLVIADHQRAGRGRRGRAWNSAPGRDLLVSLVLRPPGPAREALAVTLVVATAVSVALAKLLDVECMVKWPNDVVTREGKIAGILAESALVSGGVGYLVAGLGINVNAGADELPAVAPIRPVSCRTLTGAAWDRALVLADVLGTIEAYYDRFCRDGFAPLRAAYEARLWQMGRPVAFERDGRRGSGRVLGVAGDGALRVASDAGGGETVLYGETVEVLE